MLSFTWEYDYARGGAAVHVTPSEGEREEVALVANGNVAQILCNALAAECSGKRDGAVMPWLGYINPPRPVVEAGHLCDEECGDPSHPQDGRLT